MEKGRKVEVRHEKVICRLKMKRNSQAFAVHWSADEFITFPHYYFQSGVKTLCNPEVGIAGYRVFQSQYSLPRLMSKKNIFWYHSDDSWNLLQFRSGFLLLPVTLSGRRKFLFDQWSQDSEPESCYVGLSPSCSDSTPDVKAAHLMFSTNSGHHLWNVHTWIRTELWELGW